MQINVFQNSFSSIKFLSLSGNLEGWPVKTEADKVKQVL